MVQVDWCTTTANQRENVGHPDSVLRRTFRRKRNAHVISLYKDHLLYTQSAVCGTLYTEEYAQNRHIYIIYRTSMARFKHVSSAFLAFFEWAIWKYFQNYCNLYHEYLSSVFLYRKTVVYESIDLISRIKLEDRIDKNNHMRIKNLTDQNINIY